MLEEKDVKQWCAFVGYNFYYFFFFLNKRIFLHVNEKLLEATALVVNRVNNLVN